MKKTFRLFMQLAFSITFLTACSGGGVSGVPPVIASSSAPAVVHTTSPVPISTTNPQTAILQGVIVDHDTNGPLAGSVVYISHNLVYGETAPEIKPTDGDEETTDANGNYTLTVPNFVNYPATFYIEVFQPGRVTVHDEISVPQPGTTKVRTLGQTRLTADEANFIALTNVDRAKWGQAPLVPDETSEEVARLWTSFMITGYFEHYCQPTDVGCPDKLAYIASQDTDYARTSENVAEEPGQPFQTAEAEFMAESTLCPVPVNVQTCPYTEQDGHFLDITNHFYTWIGVAESFDGLYEHGEVGLTNYFDQEFSLPSNSGPTIN